MFATSKSPVFRPALGLRLNLFQERGDPAGRAAVRGRLTLATPLLAVAALDLVSP
jgi:hypothetical protein